MKMVMKILIVAMAVFIVIPSGASGQLPESSELPTMPEEYRDKGKNKRNPIGMSVLENAEKAADENYYGTEVVPLEESRRILKERKEAEKVKAAPSGQTPE